MNPYHEYIGLSTLASLWAHERHDPQVPAQVGLAVTRHLKAFIEADPRAYAPRAAKSWRLADSIDLQLRLCERIQDGRTADAAVLGDSGESIIEGLRQRNSCGPEDALFAGIHRVAECWCEVAMRLLQDPRRDQAERYFVTADILEMLARTFAILDLMVLKDYHPLRVALKGSSGAQSEGMLALSDKIQTIVREGESHLAESAGAGTDILLNEPTGFPDATAGLLALTALDAAHRTLFFSHYLRAVVVQGRQGLGALGAGTAPLRKRFELPEGLVYDRARTKHALWHNFSMAKAQGTTVARFERGRVVDTAREQDEVLSASVLEKLVDLVTSDGSFEAMKDLLTENCVLQLFRTSRPYRGLAGIANFFDELRLFSRLFDATLTLETGPAGKHEVHYTCTDPNGRRVNGSLAVGGSTDTDGRISYLQLETRG
jgi:hypothetical protein